MRPWKLTTWRVIQAGRAPIACLRAFPGRDTVSRETVQSEEEGRAHQDHVLTVLAPNTVSTRAKIRKGLNARVVSWVNRGSRSRQIQRATRRIVSGGRLT